MMASIVVLAAMLLIPIVPAYVLFKALPSNADAEGPFQGLKVKLGGAFAGYFVVLLVVFTLRNDWAPPAPPPAYQVWQVQGTLLDPDGKPLGALLQDVIRIKPETFVNRGGGSFEVTVLAKPGPMGDAQLPTLDIAYQPYAEFPVSLDGESGGAASVHVARDDVRHVLKIVDPIRLQPLTAYASTGTPPAPEPGGAQ
jgi:hypothetical protein